MNFVLKYLKNESLDDGFEASALGESIYAAADDWDSLKQNIREAVICHFDDNEKRIIRLHFVKEEVMIS